MKILKQIRWALNRPKLEQNLSRYCSIEFREADQSWAFHKALHEHKINYFGEN